MARTNSPPHPSFSLPKSIAWVGMIFEADRQNPIDREVAAKHMGYAGKSGASDKALASLGHYGLVEKVGKGQVRVSRLGVDILHPDPTDPESKNRALLQAGTKPELFVELRSQFPEYVSEDALKSYLLRNGFNDAALNPAMNAYLETSLFLEQSKVFESGGLDDETGAESNLQDNNVGDEMQDETVLDKPKPVMASTSLAKSVPYANGVQETEWMRNPLGRGKAVRVLVTGEMRGKEIGKLIKLLEAQKAILDDDEEEDWDG